MDRYDTPFSKGWTVRNSGVHNYPPQWNGAPRQELLVIRGDHPDR
jgi:hypothetical protein